MFKFKSNIISDLRIKSKNKVFKLLTEARIPLPRYKESLHKYKENILDKILTEVLRLLAGVGLKNQVEVRGCSSRGYYIKYKKLYQNPFSSSSIVIYS